MRRWLSAIFALHFLVTVGLFAYGHADLTATTVVNPQQALTLESGPVHDGDLLGSAPDHGLTDSPLELPEWLQQAVVVMPLTHTPGRPQSPQASVATPPWLDGPQRPPRTAWV